MDMSFVGEETLPEVQADLAVAGSGRGQTENGGKVYRTIVRWALMIGVF